jgi:hypothetical protein
MRSYGAAGTDESRLQLANWSSRLEEFHDIRLSIQLQLCINEGNDDLKALLHALNAHDEERIRKSLADVQALVVSMIEEKRDDFTASAEKILMRALEIAGPEYSPHVVSDHATWRRGYVLRGRTKVAGQILVHDGLVIVRARNGLQVEFPAGEVSTPVYVDPAPDASDGAAPPLDAPR